LVDILKRPVMKMKWLAAACVLILCLQTGKGQNKPYSPPFLAGEKLTFLLHYGILNGGRGTLEVHESTLDGKAVYHAVARANTIGLADKLYKVEDAYESFIDPKTGLPLKAIRNIREGRYRYYNETYFDRDSNRVYSQLSGYHDTPEGIIDMVSALYYLRLVDRSSLAVGDKIDLMTYFADEIYPLPVRYRGMETLKTRLGTYRCHVFAPVTEPGRVFKTESDMLMWFTDDDNFIPIRIQFDMWVGSMKVDLVEYSGLKYPLSSRLD